MKHKKQIVMGVAVVVALVIGLLAFRISSWNQTFGLSKEVISGTIEPSAEETIQLYFYHSNRQDKDGVRQLLAKNCTPDCYDWFMGPNHFFEDLNLVKIGSFSTWDNPKEVGNVYRVEECQVIYNQSFLRASQKETNASENFRFILVQEKKGGAWKIYSIGKG